MLSETIKCYHTDHTYLHISYIQLLVNSHPILLC